MNKTTTITEATFIDASGKSIDVSSVVTEKDCWFVAKEKRWALSHRAILKIARAAGISRNYDVEESPLVSPNHKNEMEHIVRVTIHCTAKVKGKPKACVHDIENYMTVTGEANKVNTPTRGRGYLRKMAEKRAFDIAVLEHLGLYDTTFSEEESATMAGKAESNNIEISNVDMEHVSDEVNSLTACDTIEKLNDMTQKIATSADKYNKVQLSFLQNIIDDRIISITANRSDSNNKPF